MNRKSELRDIVLDIIFQREKVFLDPFQFGHLTAGVAELLDRRNGGGSSSIYTLPSEKSLDEEDWSLVQEIFWDLIAERVINLGLDSANSEFPWFRLHSEAVKNAQQHQTL